MTMDAEFVESLSTGGPEQLRCKRAAELSTQQRQVRPAALMLTVVVDTAAVVNLHMVTRAGWTRQSSRWTRVKAPETSHNEANSETDRGSLIFHITCRNFGRHDSFTDISWWRFPVFFPDASELWPLLCSLCKRTVMWPLSAGSYCHSASNVKDVTHTHTL